MATAKHTLLCQFVHLHHIARLGFTLSCTMCKDQGCPLISSFYTESFPLNFDAEESQSFSSAFSISVSVLLQDLLESQALPSLVVD
jgi:hypothetical protein